MSTTPFTFGLPKTTTATTNTGFTFGTFGTANSGTTGGTSLFVPQSTAATPSLGTGMQTTKPTMTAFGASGFGMPSTATAVTNISNTVIGQHAASSTGLAPSSVFSFSTTNPAAAAAQPGNAQPAFGIAPSAVSTSGAAATAVATNQPLFGLPAPTGTISSGIQASPAPSGISFGSLSAQQTKTTSGVINTTTPIFGSPASAASTTTSAGQAFGQLSLPGSASAKTTSGTAPLNLSFVSPQTTQPAAVSTSISTGSFQFPQQSGSPAITATAAFPASGSALKFGITSTTGTSTVAISAVTATTAGQSASVNPTSTAMPTTSLSALNTTTSATNVSTVPTKLPTTMTYNQLEELINKWTHELDEQERYFSDEANRINSWDQALLTNSEKIAALYEKVEACKRDQTQLEQEFELIESQQRELEGLLEVVEKASNDLVPRSQLHSDFEREALLQTASNVDLELGQLLTDLKEMASQVNATSDREGALSGKRDSAGDEKQSETRGSGDTSSSVLADSGPGPTAVQQVTRIINCHLQSLNWIHQNSQDLMERIKALEIT